MGKIEMVRGRVFYPMLCEKEWSIIKQVTRYNREAKVRMERSPEKIFVGRVSEIGRYADFATQKGVTRGRQFGGRRAAS